MLLCSVFIYSTVAGRKCEINLIVIDHRCKKTFHKNKKTLKTLKSGKIKKNVYKRWIKNVSPNLFNLLPAAYAIGAV